MMDRPVNRVEPSGPPNLYQTYSVTRPLSTHTRIATCQEIGCLAYANGWQTIIDISTELGEQQAKYIRWFSGRHYTLAENLPMLRFTFSPEQQCFAEHRVRIRNDPIMRVLGGDYRANFGLIRRHTSMESFADDLHEATERVRNAVEKG